MCIETASRDSQVPIVESDVLIIRSAGWETAGTATTVGEQLADLICRTFARLHIAVDRGVRSASESNFTEAFRQSIGRNEGRIVLNDKFGVSVYPTEPRPLFLGGSGSGAWPPISEQKLVDSFSAGLSLKDSLTERERNAFDLFSSSREVRSSPEAQFALLFTAIETLLEVRPRPIRVQEHVDQLVRLTRDANLEESEKQSLMGTLRWLKSHSIRKSGREFVTERLGRRDYSSRSPATLFLECYDLRNRLVHGAQPFPDREEIRKLINPLDRMVCDILTGALLDLPSE